MGADTFQHVHGAHHVGIIGIDRLLIGSAHQRLGRQMEHDLRLGLMEDLLQMGKVPHIADHAADLRLHAGDMEQVVAFFRCQRIAGDFGSCQQQHTAKPCALEAGMSGDQHPLAFVKLQHHPHTFQGAEPSAHNFSSNCLSLRVSMHCQKPACL